MKSQTIGPVDPATKARINLIQSVIDNLSEGDGWKWYRHTVWALYELKADIAGAI